ncbi:MAG: hypothetical protein ACFFBP_03385 [Promethearchaeota archaeon]
MERKVKGTLVKLIIKGIKSDKFNAKDYDNILSDEAKELVNKRILDSIWYPFDAYYECYHALTTIFARESKEILIKWGQQFGEAVMSTIYKNIIVEGKVDKLLEMYPRFHKLLFNFGKLQLEKVSDNEVHIAYIDFEPKFEYWFYTSIGWMQKSFEMCLKKKVKFEFLKKSWEGDKITQYILTWTP